MGPGGPHVRREREGLAVQLTVGPWWGPPVRRTEKKKGGGKRERSGRSGGTGVGTEIIGCAQRYAAAGDRTGDRRHTPEGLNHWADSRMLEGKGAGGFYTSARGEAKPKLGRPEGRKKLRSRGVPRPAAASWCAGEGKGGVLSSFSDSGDPRR